MTRSPLVSIVIPTLARPETLATCLDSIVATVDVAHEVICVVVEDDVSTRDMLAERGGDVRLVIQPEPGGYVRAANLGGRAARGTWVTILNDDCTLLPHTIANAVRFLEAPAHRGVGQAAFFHTGIVERNVHAQIRIEGTWYFVRHVRGLCYANFGLARRTLYERLGWLDERFVMYGADPDFSLRVWHEAELAVVPCPGALIAHAEIGEARQDGDNRRLFSKWEDPGVLDFPHVSRPLTRQAPDH